MNLSLRTTAAAGALALLLWSESHLYPDEHRHPSQPHTHHEVVVPVFFPNATACASFSGVPLSPSGMTYWTPPALAKLQATSLSLQ